MKKLAVLGAGSWGTALALNCARQENSQILLWGHQAEHVATLQRTRCNQRYLPDCPLPDNLQVSADISQIKDCDAVLLVVPSMAYRQTLALMAPWIDQQAIGWAIKGFDKTDHNLLSRTFQQHFPRRDFAVVAGPSFAKEVANGKPTALCVASKNLDFAEQYASYLNNNNVVIYLTDDVVATQVGGALKNVIAIATGMADGLELGANTRAALITRGLHEISRLGKALGGRAETFMGLSGLGDLVLTCTDDQSRNRRFGKLLGQGYSIEAAQAEIGQTVEGLYTTNDCVQLAEKLAIRMPITQLTQRILSGQLTPQAAAEQLLRAAPKAEQN